MDAARIVELIILIGGSLGVGGFAVALLNKKKINAEAAKAGADAAKVLSDASIAMLAPMQNQITVLDAKLVTTQTRADSLDRQLRATNVELDHTKDAMVECTQMIERMHSQLEYYYQRYGPPTGQNRLIP